MGNSADWHYPQFGERGKDTARLLIEGYTCCRMSFVGKGPVDVKRLGYNQAMKVIECHFVWAIIAALFVSGCAVPSGHVKTDAIQQLEAQAQQGDADSQYALGLHYTLESERIVDHNRGYRWFLSAAEMGHDDAQYMAGLAKLNARGTFLDRKGAVDYFELAALQGHAYAQYQLGMAYLNGAGVDKDLSWGRQWLEQAAWHEHKEAQFLLGALFAGGVGGQINTPEAWRWLQKADANEHKLALVALNKLSGRMSAKELSLGEKLLAQPMADEQKLFSLPRVRYVQTILNLLGYSAGAEDGVVGVRTLSAVNTYLQDNKLPRETQVLQLIESLRGR